MAFDTGSSDLFLPSAKCDSSCEGHSLYDPSASSTSQDLGKQFNLDLGHGSSASGELYSDAIEIAGLTVCRNTPPSFPSLYADVPYQGYYADAGRRNKLFFGL